MSIPLGELLIEKQSKPGFAAASGYQITVALNTDITDITPELAQEGLVREVIRAIQDYRKKLDLAIEQRIRLVIDADPEILAAIQRFEDVLRDNVLLQELAFDKKDGMEYVSIEDKSVGMLIE
ncbi:Isoleucine--tRNA ligase [compost metagenome]